MNEIELPSTNLLGLALKHKTTNENGQSMIDCGNLWQKFEQENIANNIPDKLTEEVVAVYHQYEGDYTKPFSYFIGCKVKPGTVVPQGMDHLTIPSGTYHKIIAQGTMPECIAEGWKEIWNSEIPRAYNADFEVYDHRSKDWKNAEVDIYFSVN
ncbi:hypothetical protein BH23BAC1_BH23BAC1_31490 [soil metagenome]